MRAAMIGDQATRDGWGPMMGSRSHGMAEALRRLGVEVFEISLPEFETDPAASLNRVVRTRPDFLIGPNFNYPLLASAYCPELFDLGIPLVALWDDPIGALANYGTHCLTAWGANRRKGPLTRLWGRVRARLFDDRPPPDYFRAIMRKPHIIHLSYDTGFIRAAEQLDLVDKGQTIWHPNITFDAFFRAGETPVEPERDLAFCGNVYLSQLESAELWRSPWHRALTERICRRKLEDCAASVWDLLLDELARTPRPVLRQYGMFTDQKLFWDYWLFLAWCAVNTQWRIEILRCVDRPVHLFGIFSDPQTRSLLERYPNLQFAGNAHHFKELPHVFASTRVNLCIGNAITLNGGTTKQFDCLASGGFFLCDTKTDLYRVFSKSVDSIFFRNPAELKEKTEYFLARPGERREIVQALRETLKRECNLEVLFRRVLDRLRAAPAPRQAAWHSPARIRTRRNA